jgi:hypothetical protein
MVLCAALATSGAACLRARVARDEAPVPAPPASLAGADQARTQGGAASGAAETQPSGLAAMAAARKLVRTGQIALEVRSCAEAVPALTRLAVSLGGYVSESRSQRDAQGRERAWVTLRVPAERFDEILSGAAGLGTLRSKNVSAQDVTKAYTDLETRLRVKRETAERLREILRARAAGLADVLAAERELARVTEEIEQAEGERRFYDQQIALSTLSVELVEPGAIATSSALDPLREAFGDAARVLTTSLAAMVYATAFLAPWALVLWALWRIVRAIRKRRASKKAPD